MRRYFVAGADLKAMKAFGSVAKGKTIGYYTDKVPGWDELHSQWHAKGTAVGLAKASCGVRRPE